ncbi:hypothetical protein EMEDMD4_790252 [Sinorhizobium medicae]|uniref:Uncharacterized protein n=1 Tax=Sinorhizobium medicae TaxID=110321 RepID=A0A508XAU7_9HYPH|nr:hypothetical protein EMEDMD4_790252 [Sinorhizobium medicae]
MRERKLPHAVAVLAPHCPSERTFGFARFHRPGVENISI